MSYFSEFLGALRPPKDTQFLTSISRGLEKPRDQWGEKPVEVAVAHLLLDYPGTVQLGLKALQTRSEQPIGEQLVEQIARRALLTLAEEPNQPLLVSDRALLIYLAKRNNQFIDPLRIEDGTQLTLEVAAELDRALTYIGLSVLDYVRTERLHGRLR